jgi:hypothetical protein
MYKKGYLMQLGQDYLILAQAGMPGAGIGKTTLVQVYA